jgi:hypothetical protein
MPTKSERLRVALDLPPSAICQYGSSEEPSQWKIQPFGEAPRYLSPAEVDAILTAQPPRPKGGYRHGTPGGARPKGGPRGRPKKQVDAANDSIGEGEGQ